MIEAAIVATARTAIGKALRGVFNDTDTPVLAATVARAVIERTGIDPARVDDFILGCAAQCESSGGKFQPEELRE